MESILPTMRVLRSLSRRQTAPVWQAQQVRTKATAQRQRKSLRISPDSSFIPGPGDSQDHIIYNPPPAPPSEYHTPYKFLPHTDPRWKLHQLANPDPPTAPSPAPATSTASSSEKEQNTLAEYARSRLSKGVSADGVNTRGLPPTVGRLRGRKYHLTLDDVEEIRRLRALDEGRTWPVHKLAEKFGCSRFFIRICAYNVEASERALGHMIAARSKWGKVKREAREERDRRVEGWGRAE